MTYIIRIDPDGRIEECEGDDLMAVASRHFGIAHQLDAPAGLDIVTMIPPTGAPPTYPRTDESYLVGAVYEWERLLPGGHVNPKAWGLYGRSPLVGTVFVAHDSYDDGPGEGGEARPPLPPEFIERMREDWVRPPLMRRDNMRVIAENNGLTWPWED